MNKESTELGDQFPYINPEGKGGFGDNPQNINAGGRPKNQQSFAYWMNFFKDLTVAEFKAYETTHPDDERYVAESLAYARVAQSRSDLKNFREVADRTEGKPKQSISYQFDDPVTEVNINIKKNSSDN